MAVIIRQASLSNESSPVFPVQESFRSRYVAVLFEG